MYQLILEMELKKDVTLKESYEKISKLIRLFINKNNKQLKSEHYQPVFSYYTFSNFFPKEKQPLFKKGGIYSVELRSLKAEFLDLKKFKNLETEDLRLVGVNAGKMYYHSKGELKSETPIFLNSKRIEDDIYEKEVIEKVRENIIFRYLKSGTNSNDDRNFLRQEIIDNITINRKVITIPFQEKKVKNGNSLLYHCMHVDIKFKNNDIAKEVEQIVYAGGLGLNTSNGFGFMKTGGM